MFKGFGRFIGITPRHDAARILDATLTPAASGADSIWSMVRALAGAGKRNRLPTDTTDDGERFRFAMQHYGVSESGIADRITQSHDQFWMNAVCAAVGIGLAVYQADTSHSVPAILLGLSLTVLFTTKALRMALFNAQLRTRRLLTFRAFWKAGHRFPRTKGGMR
ncbi:hypothetical protein [Asaia sp. VD9]|uniref:hypothetical protein n=1 Tax=Asaia sp. VD9 TaxID=3081235 RepID=UPI003019FF16